MKNHKNQRIVGNKDAMIILNQALTIAKWINSFDPESINQIDLKLPRELVDFQGFVNVTMDSITPQPRQNSSFKMKNSICGGKRCISLIGYQCLY